MASFNDAFENKLFDFLLRAQSLSLGGATASWTGTPTFYIGLLATVGNDAGGEVETSGTNYARVSLAAALTAFNGTHGTTTGASSGTDGTGENASAVNFNTPGAGGWGSVAGFGIYEAANGGSPIIKNTLTVGPKTINQGDTVSFAAGSLSVQIDN